MNDAFDSFSIIVGLAAVGIGFYELFTKKLLWRDNVELTEEKVKKFLPYDAATYIIAGALLALTGAGQYIPVMKETWAVFTAMGLSFAAIAVNVIFSNRILGKPKNNPRLK